MVGKREVIHFTRDSLLLAAPYTQAALLRISHRRGGLYPKPRTSAGILSLAAYHPPSTPA